MQRILATRQRVVKNFVFLRSNAFFNAFLREEGGTRMRDGRSLRNPHFFACFITNAFPKLRTLLQSPTATAPSRREPFTKHILPLPLVCFHSSAIAFFEPRDYRVVFGCGFKRKQPPVIPVELKIFRYKRKIRPPVLY